MKTKADYEIGFQKVDNVDVYVSNVCVKDDAEALGSLSSNGLRPLEFNEASSLLKFVPSLRKALENKMFLTTRVGQPLLSRYVFSSDGEIYLRGYSWEDRLRGHATSSIDILAIGVKYGQTDTSDVMSVIRNVSRK